MRGRGVLRLALPENKKGALSRSRSADREIEKLLFEQVADFCQENNVSSRRWWWRGSFFFLHHGNKFVGWLNDDEKDDRRSNHKTNYGIDDHTDIEHVRQFFALIIDELTNLDAEGYIWITAQKLEDRLNDSLGKSGHNRAKGSADDDTGGKVNDVAFEDEFFEFS